jgi:glycosyltransferase involved in cell wall biosynthesis
MKSVNRDIHPGRGPFPVRTRIGPPRVENRRRRPIAAAAPAGGTPNHARAAGKAHNVPAMRTSDDIRLSAVVPCYREALSIPIMHERLTAVFEELDVDYEIIFVDSGSPDNTPDVLAAVAARDEHVTVVRHTRAFGPEGAYSSGMHTATGDAVILLDGDLQDPPEVIPELVARWREGNDVVYGQRTSRGGSRPMNIARKCFYRVFQRLSYVPIPLDAGDFSLLDRRVVDTINALPEKHRFTRGLRAYVGYRQVAVPYHRPERLYGRASTNLRVNFGWARRAIISFSYLPLDLIGLVAITTTVVAGAMLVAAVVLKLTGSSSAPAGFTTLIVAILFVGGIQMICLSVIGTYLAHMYEEIKARPPFIVDHVINPPRPRDRPRFVEVGRAGAHATASEPAQVSGHDALA